MKRTGPRWRHELGNLVTALGFAFGFSAGLFLLLPQRAAFAAQEVAVEMQIRIDGELITLAEADWVEATAQADKILRTCAYDGGDREAEEWQEALAAPSGVHLFYDGPITLHLGRREIAVSEALMLIEDEHFLSQPLLFHEGSVSFVAKCDGLEMIRFECLPALRDHFPPGYQSNCHILDQVQNP